MVRISFLLILTIITASITEILLKYGMVKKVSFNFHCWRVFNEIISMFINPYLVLGFVGSAITMILWLEVLAKAELGYAFAMTSAMYIIILFLSHLIFKEDITILKLVGVVAITIGVLFISISNKIN